jgi:hypothetical protein
VLYENSKLELHDAGTMALLWTKTFPNETPAVWARPDDGTLALGWSVDSAHVKAELKADPTLRSRMPPRPNASDTYVQVVDVATGKPLGRFVVDTGAGSFHVANAFAAGDWAIVEDTEHRTLVYSLASGQLKGRLFGGDAEVSAARGLAYVQNEPGQLVLYDLATMERRDALIFSSPVATMRFSADGTRFFVLTGAQEAYVLDVGP